MRWVDIKCWFSGHAYEFTGFVDGEEWPGVDHWEYAVFAVFRCKDCHRQKEEFVLWGTTDESKEALEQLEKEFYRK